MPLEVSLDLFHFPGIQTAQRKQKNQHNFMRNPIITATIVVCLYMLYDITFIFTCKVCFGFHLRVHHDLFESIVHLGLLGKQKLIISQEWWLHLQNSKKLSLDSLFPKWPLYSKRVLAIYVFTVHVNPICCWVATPYNSFCLILYCDLWTVSTHHLVVLTRIWCPQCKPSNSRFTASDTVKEIEFPSFLNITQFGTLDKNPRVGSHNTII